MTEGREGLRLAPAIKGKPCSRQDVLGPEEWVFLPAAQTKPTLVVGRLYSGSAMRVPTRILRSHKNPVRTPASHSRLAGSPVGQSLAGKWSLKVWFVFDMARWRWELPWR